MPNSKKEIEDALSALYRSLPQGVQLLCVSKYYSEDAILAAYEAGARCFGESRVQELQRKAEVLPKDIEWHFIGHLQTNKIKKLLPYVTLIHGVDSWYLLEKINEVAYQNMCVVNVLLEVKISHDEMKSGFPAGELMVMLREGNWRSLHNVCICGLMGVASMTTDTECVRKEFAQLHSLWKELQGGLFADSPNFNILSMGMTNDWKIAVEEGSTMIRIGHGVFGDTE